MNERVVMLRMLQMDILDIESTALALSAVKSSVLFEMLCWSVHNRRIDGRLGLGLKLKGD